MEDSILTGGATSLKKQKQTLGHTTTKNDWTMNPILCSEEKLSEITWPSSFQDILVKSASDYWFDYLPKVL